MAGNLAIPAVAGSFAYRFSGYAMKQDRPWYLTGVGRFDIDPDGNLTGTHRSAVMPIQGFSMALEWGDYALKGTMTVRSDGCGDANIVFTLTSGKGRDVRGEFFVILAGDTDHLWFTCKADEVLPKEGEPPGKDEDNAAKESVMLEAVRVAF